MLGEWIQQSVCGYGKPFMLTHFKTSLTDTDTIPTLDVQKQESFTVNNIFSDGPEQK